MLRAVYFYFLEEGGGAGGGGLLSLEDTQIFVALCFLSKY